MIYLVASDRKPALGGKGGIYGEGTGAPPVTARTWEQLLYLPTASHLQGVTCCPWGSGVAIQARVRPSSCGYSVGFCDRLCGGCEAGGVEGTPPRTGWVQRRWCWSPLVFTMQKQETSTCQWASWAALGCFLRKSSPYFLGVLQGEGISGNLYEGWFGPRPPCESSGNRGNILLSFSSMGVLGVAGFLLASGQGGDHSSSPGCQGWPRGGRTPTSPWPGASLGITCDAF